MSRPHLNYLSGELIMMKDRKCPSCGGYLVRVSVNEMQCASCDYWRRARPRGKFTSNYVEITLLRLFGIK